MSRNDLFTQEHLTGARKSQMQGVVHIVQSAG